MIQLDLFETYIDFTSCDFFVIPDINVPFVDD